MCICFLEVVRAIQWIEPRIQEEFCPISVSDNHARRRQTVFVLRDDQVNLTSLEIRKRLDNTVWRYDGLILEQKTLETTRVHDVILNLEIWVHNQSTLIQVPEICAVRKLRKSMAQCGDSRPRAWRSFYFVIRPYREECRIACKCKLHDVFRDRIGIPCFAA